MRKSLITLAVLTTLAIGNANASAQSIDLKILGLTPKTSKIERRKTEKPKQQARLTEYIVQPGDTLESLSKAHTTTWQRVWAKNPALTNPDVLEPGDKLTIPQNDEVLPERTLPTPVVTAVRPPADTASEAVATPTPTVVGGCGDNQYAQFIYQHESGCNLNAVNAGGCRGIGQACPGSKLPCSADYACQDAYFTAYAARYGGWPGAYAFWVANGWW